MIPYRPWLTQVGVSTSHPLAFVVVAVYVATWLIFDPQSFGWQSAATVATWVMTLFIQRAEHRDTQAIHAKLDELLRAHADPFDFATAHCVGERIERVADQTENLLDPDLLECANKDVRHCLRHLRLL